MTNATINNLLAIVAAVFMFSAGIQLAREERRIAAFFLPLAALIATAYFSSLLITQSLPNSSQIRAPAGSLGLAVGIVAGWKHRTSTSKQSPFQAILLTAVIFLAASYVQLSKHLWWIPDPGPFDLIIPLVECPFAQLARPMFYWWTASIGELILYGCALGCDAILWSRGTLGLTAFFRNGFRRTDQDD